MVTRTDNNKTEEVKEQYPSFDERIATGAKNQTVVYVDYGKIGLEPKSPVGAMYTNVAFQANAVAQAFGKKDHVGEGRITSSKGGENHNFGLHAEMHTLSALTQKLNTTFHDAEGKGTQNQIARDIEFKLGTDAMAKCLERTLDIVNSNTITNSGEINSFAEATERVGSALFFTSRKMIKNKSDLSLASKQKNETDTKKKNQ